MLRSVTNLVFEYIFCFGQWCKSDVCLNCYRFCFLYFVPFSYLICQMNASVVFPYLFIKECVSEAIIFFLWQFQLDRLVSLHCKTLSKYWYSLTVSMLYLNIIYGHILYLCPPLFPPFVVSIKKTFKSVMCFLYNALPCMHVFVIYVHAPYFTNNFYFLSPFNCS